MNEVRIRRLNNLGLVRMGDYLASFAAAPARSVDFEKDVRPILTGGDTTSHAPNIVFADGDRQFQRRYDLAEYLHELVPKLGLQDPARDRGLWAWIALLWFDQLAPAKRDGRKIGERARWLPEYGWNYYRHLVLGPYLIYSNSADCPQRAAAFLHNPPHTPGELVGQLAATQDVAQSKAAIGAATALYYDPQKKSMKPGAGGDSAGSPRRFRTVLDQLDRTFDLQSLTEDRLTALLPSEFERFKR